MDRRSYSAQLAICLNNLKLVTDQIENLTKGLESDLLETLDVLGERPVGWISVKDMLPIGTGSTLICTNSGKVCTARYYKKQRQWNGAAGKNAAYWMPLPEPPKETLE